MRLFGVDFFSKSSDPNIVGVAGYHSPHSLTWSWSLVLIRPKTPDCGRMLGLWRRKHNCGTEWGLQIMRHQLQLSTQKPMWYRDLFRDATEREAEREGLLYRPVAPEPVEIDSGKSLH